VASGWPGLSRGNTSCSRQPSYATSWGVKAHENRIVADLGRRIAELRAEKDLTQERLAERAELAPRYVQAIEAGAENPTIRTLIGLAAVLKVPIATLFEPPKSRVVRAGRPKRQR
jgi:DNA-binding XRE family transcriptional regulator